jgi:hypothetical protein
VAKKRRGKEPGRREEHVTGRRNMKEERTEKNGEEEGKIRGRANKRKGK